MHIVAIDSPVRSSGPIKNSSQQKISANFVGEERKKQNKI